MKTFAFSSEDNKNSQQKIIIRLLIVWLTFYYQMWAWYDPNFELS